MWCGVVRCGVVGGGQRQPTRWPGTHQHPPTPPHPPHIPHPNHTHPYTSTTKSAHLALSCPPAPDLGPAMCMYLNVGRWYVSCGRASGRGGREGRAWVRDAPAQLCPPPHHHTHTHTHTPQLLTRPRSATRSRPAIQPATCAQPPPHPCRHCAPGTACMCQSCRLPSVAACLRGGNRGGDRRLCQAARA